MNISSQEKFYSSISKYYSEIFPFNPGQLNFIKKQSKDLKDLQILDIGCATGELAGILAQKGAIVQGMDLNDELLSQARSKHNYINLRFQKGNMLEAKKDFNEKSFDVVLCFGNTLVHLTDIGLIKTMLKGVFTVLKPDGKFLLQILNYDHIIDDRIQELPLIETENVRFIRNYEFDSLPLIRFITKLQIKESRQIVSNETLLLALERDTLKRLLTEAGFSEIEFYANFKMEAFGGNHLPLVVVCKKKEMN